MTRYALEALVTQERSGGDLRITDEELEAVCDRLLDALMAFRPKDGVSFGDCALSADLNSGKFRIEWEWECEHLSWFDSDDVRSGWYRECNACGEQRELSTSERIDAQHKVYG